MLTLNAHAVPGGEPKPDEQRAIDQIEKPTVASCEKEGLSQAQLACIAGMKTFDDMQRIMACPAIASKKPGWLIVSHATVNAADVGIVRVVAAAH